MLNYEELAIQLSYCESETEVINLLKSEEYWDNSQYWMAFGDNDNNWSTIGNQQSEADSALVEKLVNSIDAMLMKECLRRGVDPTSSNAPNSIASALETYFGIKGGRLEDLTSSERTKLAKDSIILAATGENKYPNLTIVDNGEGQSPFSMPNTILSINKSNKLRVPFVQGKFNMGGTGVLRFCGENNIQLIISRRCPDINSQSDTTHDLWGVTVIRRIRPNKQNGRRSSMYQYLTDNNREIISFNAPNGLPIIPTSKKTKKNMEYGMYCKLFEYRLPSRLCSNINMNLYSRLSTLLPNLAYPIYLDECRNYKANTMFRTLSGLNVRLKDQTQEPENNIEKILYPKFTIDGQVLSAVIYVFKKLNADGKKIDLSQYKSDEGIILTQNGQTHGRFDKRFYARNAVGLSYLADSLLTIVDCTNIDEATREDLFMNSRDRMSSGNFSEKLEHELEDYFKCNEELKRIQDKRRQEALADKLDDAKPLEEVLNSVLKSSPVLSRLFITGDRLKNPMNLGSAPEEENFQGKYNPTYFTLIQKKHGHFSRETQIGRKCRVKFKTDAVNDFFSREDYPGEYSLLCNGEICENHNMNLHNGYATLTIELPSAAKVGDVLNFECIVSASSMYNEFKNEFVLNVVAFTETSGGGSGTRTPPDKDGKGGKAFSPTGIRLPNVSEVYKDNWEEHDFDKYAALDIKKAETEVYDFYVNMDNIHLQSEIKQIAKNEAKVKLFKARYKYALVLIGLGIIGSFKNKEITEAHQDDSLDDAETLVEKCSKMLSPIILPMIDVLGNADLTNVINL